MTHRIYFAQHGLAVDKKENPERPLSPAGIHQSQLIARALLASKMPLTRIFHSGKLRASQTAEIFARTINISSVSAIDGLSANDEVTRLAQNLSVDHALYIGHLPQLEKLVAYLLTGNESTDIIQFQNSGVVCLESKGERYRVRWLLTPALLDNTQWS